MPTGVIVVLIVTLASLALLQRRVVRHWRARPARIAGTLAVVVAALLTLATPVGLLAGNGRIDPDRVRWISAVGLTWLATVFYLLLTLLVLGLLWVLSRLVRLVRPGFDGAPLRRAVALVGVVGAVGATLYGLVEAATPRVTHTPVRLASMPAAFGTLRVALITDIHAGPVRTRSFVQGVVDRANAENPDVVILGGDLIDGTVAQIGEDLAPLRGLRAPFGVLAVTGNHEYYAGDAVNWVQRWRDVGVRPLVNEAVRLERGGAAVTVVGVNDRKGTAPLAVDYDAAFAGVDPAGFALAVAHEPLQGREFAARGADLQVAGHTHGGQLWPFRYFVKLQQPALQGLESVDGMPVYTSRGAGAWGPPVRVAAPPEIAILELSAA
ncbi:MULTISPECIES: metallophosphoesterase [Tsukamurella]|uniref:Metallophosphoesterase n=2 Tax=Tsukamurella TaxID=2060 RepID=A0A5C5S4P1_9ACTN|nr:MULTISPECIES: metallophosphoesterase [Tsukamurella]NMD54999.1 metallophosphoesterase [Tsukamurella columbiensis]TWS30034.1 metallophosphoesterase [Tsukamurella conjunctivitidis]